MVPGSITQLMAIHALAKPEINQHFIGELLIDHLIELKTDVGYQLSERGARMVEMLCETPLPEQRWIDPREIDD